jgi:hypothetical protein
MRSKKTENFVFQTEYLELYEEAASRGLTILLPDIREDILIRLLKETVPLILALKKRERVSFSFYFILSIFMNPDMDPDLDVYRK